jgi:hypothetical protein
MNYRGSVPIWGCGWPSRPKLTAPVSVGIATDVAESPDVPRGPVNRQRCLLHLLAAETCRVLSGNQFRRPGLVRRPHVRKLGKQILVMSYSIARHLPIGEDTQEVIAHVVGEYAAIVGE